MPQKRFPRKGSMQVWPRKRAARSYARIRTWPARADARVLGFAGFKAGMTHIVIKDEKSTSRTKGDEIPIPVTILECPPLKVFGVRLYKHGGYGIAVSGQMSVEKFEKELERKLPKMKNRKDASSDGIVDVRLLVHSQPKLTGIGRKKPDVFELGLGGKTVADKLTAAKALLGKDLDISDVFKAGEFCDLFAVTKGKGLQGPVKRFGVNLRSHKAEKTKRGPGNLGPWHGAKMYRVAHAGQMGYHQRSEYNKYLVFIGDQPEKINPAGGFVKFGNVKNKYVLVKGSVAGSKNRLVTMTVTRRATPSVQKDAPKIVYTSLTSQQG